MTFLLKAQALLAKVPLEVWLILALLGAWAWDRSAQYRSGYSDGEQAVEQRLRDAEAEALRKASEAFQNADKAGEERALAEAEAHNAAIEAIKRAEAEGRNPLDELF